ncbi:hypothetical protein QO034_19205 [Sedimentitalea sp. JM2-8]|uniref:Sel1 repeat-containing protein n=1 Tax=Sedimentitalea xiamensis TaxID=3050037 RepID=A0ABT7FJB0_9RHOB|nr:hypothetical protein [Sedimentitalea xiamensis]MDK3075220.1 hypothetical protein [Sedimentitalea xiamensis]
MTLTVHPDPQERAGGYAFLQLPAGSLPEGATTVAVFDAYTERWLASSDAPGAQIGIGDANWQSERVDFGPYDVQRGKGGDRLRIGPEIVNKLQEYAPLRLVVGDRGFDVSWPDTVPPRAGAAVLGGLQAVARERRPAENERFVGKVRTEPVPDAPGPAPIPEDLSGDDTGTRTGSLILPILVLVLALLAGLAAWIFWPGDTERTAENPPQENPCSLSALQAIGGGFGNAEQAIRSCGADVSPDTVLRLVEDAAAGQDGAALLLFGKLYDKEILHDPIETGIGLRFDDDPAQAAEYYFRAAQAGSGEAHERLAQTCLRLAGSDATLDKGAYNDYCP